MLLAIGLGFASVGCATTETKEAQGPTTVCREEAMTGSNVSRMTCRPRTDAERRASDQEAMRRSQNNTRRPARE
jgi:hypothetical protein